MSSVASIFSIHARAKVVVFECALDCKVGAYSVRKGDGVKVVRDAEGWYQVYVTWADGSLGRIDAERVNALAGYDVILCTCLEIRGDDANCEVHGAGAHWGGEQ